MNTYPCGVWPVMLTPYLDSGKVDYEGLKALTNWYVNQGVNGLFAACQSSEIFYLSCEERALIVQTVVQAAQNKIPIIASGHVHTDLNDTIAEMARMKNAGAEAFVLISNRLASKEEPDDIWLKNLHFLLDHTDPQLRLGMYECPYPYKRLLSEDMLRACAQSGRFYFMKDTCCDAALIAKRIALLKETPMQLYNANSATLLPSLIVGAAGFSGIMANFHPKLYLWLCQNPHHSNAQIVQDALSVMSLAENIHYPICAKYHLQAVAGLPIGLHSRVQDEKQMTQTHKQMVHSINRMAEMIYSQYCTKEG